jgi:hypothetical protein
MADEEKTLDVGSASASAESSSISAPPAPQPPPIIDPIPDGGVRAWLQVLGSFFLFLNSWFAYPLPCFSFNRYHVHIT